MNKINFVTVYCNNKLRYKGMVWISGGLPLFSAIFPLSSANDEKYLFLSPVTIYARQPKSVAEVDTIYLLKSKKVSCVTPLDSLAQVKGIQLRKCARFTCASAKG